MRLTSKQLYEGMRIPYGWGVAWWDVAGQRAILLPWGINRVMGLLRKWYWCIAQSVHNDRDVFGLRMYDKGRADGYLAAKHAHKTTLGEALITLRDMGGKHEV